MFSKHAIVNKEFDNKLINIPTVEEFRQKFISKNTLFFMRGLKKFQFKKFQLIFSKLTRINSDLGIFKLDQDRINILREGSYFYTWEHIGDFWGYTPKNGFYHPLHVKNGDMQ